MIAEVATVCGTVVVCVAMALRASLAVRLEESQGAKLRAELEHVHAMAESALAMTRDIARASEMQSRRIAEQDNKITSLQMRAGAR